MAENFLVTISHHIDNDDKAIMGFEFANEIQNIGKKTAVFLTTAGIMCAVEGRTTSIDVGKPFAPLENLIDRFIEGGGRIFVSTPCMKLRGIKNNQLIAGAASRLLNSCSGPSSVICRCKSHIVPPLSFSRQACLHRTDRS